MQLFVAYKKHITLTKKIGFGWKGDNWPPKQAGVAVCIFHTLDTAAQCMAPEDMHSQRAQRPSTSRYACLQDSLISPV
jgi:hypothetical protein